MTCDFNMDKLIEFIKCELNNRFDEFTANEVFDQFVLTIPDELNKKQIDENDKYDILERIYFSNFEKWQNYIDEEIYKKTQMHLENIEDFDEYVYFEDLINYNKVIKIAMLKISNMNRTNSC